MWERDGECELCSLKSEGCRLDMCKQEGRKQKFEVDAATNKVLISMGCRGMHERVCRTQKVSGATGKVSRADHVLVVFLKDVVSLVLCPHG